MHIPAATVWPASLIANLAMCGMSFCLSRTKGFVGLTFTIAASPFLMKSGLIKRTSRGRVLTENGLKRATSILGLKSLI